MFLPDYLAASSTEYPDRTAVLEPAGAITYRGLRELTDQVRNQLIQLGIRRGDRVGVYVPKSIDAVAVILGIMEAGAAYVPVDAGAPAPRNAFVFHDCGVKLIFVERSFEEKLRGELAALGAVPQLISLDAEPGGAGLRKALERRNEQSHAADGETVRVDPDDLAYVLYTSGSTGRPKGVMITHRNAVSFVEWCSEVFTPTCSDRFSSHAPFHFDLSILDLYTPLKHGASIVLIPDAIGKDPVRLATLIAENKITNWYSAPSILSLLAQNGRLGEHDYSNLRMVLFAGEVFPISHLKSLKQQLPHPRYFNLYGPTETNVCTFYELPPEIPPDRVAPFPIGKVCSHLRGIVVDPAGQEVARGEEGELCIAGPSVTRGYWNLPEQTAHAYLTRPGSDRWYRTGDLVMEQHDGNYTFLGRRDRMVKKRGYRIELGEIESRLYEHPEILEAAVVAIRDQNEEVKVHAHLSTPDGKRLSLIALKSFCSNHLPVYMVPDSFEFHASLPKTSTDKIDYQKLAGRN